MPKQLNRISTRRLRDLRLLVMDVDGVMTDGKLYYSAEGHVLKGFNVLDGKGLQNLRATNVRPAIISASRAESIHARARDLGINLVSIGEEDKGIAIVRLLAETGLSPHTTAYVGDDTPDLAAMRHAGTSITVPNAHQQVLATAEFITTKYGGEGAIRELCDLICSVQAPHAQ